MHANGGGYVPVPGDLIVENGTSSNAYGHVAVVDRVSGGSVYAVEQNAGASGRHTYSLSGSTLSGGYGSVRGVLHSPSNHHSNGSPPIEEGDFVAVSGSSNVYRIAGGAPLFVSSWSHVGGSHPVTVTSQAEFNKLRAQPKDGTFIQAWSGGPVFEVAGGAPIPVSAWSHLGGSAGRTVISVDRAAIDNAGSGTGVWSHLGAVPANGTLIKGYGHATVYVIAGGAPLAVAAWSHIGGQAGRSLTAVDQTAIDNAGAASGAWSHLRDVPADGTYVQPRTGNRTVYVIAGGAPLAVGNWSHVGGTTGKSVVPIDPSAIDNAGAASGAWSHLRQLPGDGTLIKGYGIATVYVIAGGAPIAVSSWAAIGGQGDRALTSIDQSAIDNAGAASGAWSHLREYPLDGTILRGGPDGPLYRTQVGAPYPLSSLPAGASFVVVDPAAISRAGQAGPWRFLRAVPPQPEPSSGAADLAAAGRGGAPAPLGARVVGEPGTARLQVEPWPRRRPLAAVARRSRSRRRLALLQAAPLPRRAPNRAPGRTGRQAEAQAAAQAGVRRLPGDRARNRPRRSFPTHRSTPHGVGPRAAQAQSAPIAAHGTARKGGVHPRRGRERPLPFVSQRQLTKPGKVETWAVLISSLSRWPSSWFVE